MADPATPTTSAVKGSKKSGTKSGGATKSNKSSKASTAPVFPQQSAGVPMSPFSLTPPSSYLSGMSFSNNANLVMSPSGVNIGSPMAVASPQSNIFGALKPPFF